jgi:adenylosuccinate lyase
MAMFYDEFNRHLARLIRAKEEVSVGKVSGAVGTFANVDPYVEKYVCSKLGLKAAPISTQIIQRDIHASYVTTIALIGASLEKLATEVRNLQRTEVRELEEPFGKGQKGSSAMPHKKNPITCERIAGLARLLRGYSLSAMENVCLWHERDITHSSVERVILPDASITLDYILKLATWVVDGLAVNKDRMFQNLMQTQGVVFSGKILLSLMSKGLSRTQAYELVQRCALEAWKAQKDFGKILKNDKQVKKHLSEAELSRCLDPKHHMKHVGRIFKRVGL